MKITISTTINGQQQEITVRPNQTLLEFLRDDLERIGSKREAVLKPVDNGAIEYVETCVVGRDVVHLYAASLGRVTSAPVCL